MTKNMISEEQKIHITFIKVSEVEVLINATHNRRTEIAQWRGW